MYKDIKLINTKYDYLELNLSYMYDCLHSLDHIKLK